MGGDEIFRFGMYSDGGSAPLSLLAVTGPTTATGTGWYTVYLTSQVVVPGGTYWLAIKFDSNPSGGSNYNYLSSGSVHRCVCDFPNPWTPQDIENVGHLTIQAHYTCP
jgi:hypothetical protein